MATGASSGSKASKIHLDNLLTQINSARQKFGYSNVSLNSDALQGGAIKSTHISSLQTSLSQANSGSGANVAMNVTNYAVGAPIKSNPLEDLYNIATQVFNYCSCNCNNCSCDCNNCSCNTQTCSCDCDRCHCDCDRCSCDGQGYVCGCNAGSGSCSCDTYVV